MTFDLYAYEFRLREIDQSGDPLAQLDGAINWELFRKTLEEVRPAERKSKAGRKPFDAVMMFKIIILQSLYNLSDDAVEYQIRDRLSFMRFLGITMADRVPDAKTIWLFREKLIEAELIETLFGAFDDFLIARGFAARKGQIIDASIVAAPRQRNTREEDETIKNGEEPQAWDETPNKQRQPDGAGHAGRTHDAHGDPGGAQGQGRGQCAPGVCARDEAPAAADETVDDA